MGILAELRGYVTEDVNKVLSRFQPPPSAAALLQNELGSIPPAPFTLGQPATTGPFQLSSTVPLVVGDPNVFTGPASSSVQVQNSSGYLISVNTGGSSYTIQPFACSTIPTQNRTGATITTIAPLSNFGNSITLIWMIPGQNPPMADGALTQGNIQSLGLLSAVNVLNANAYSQALPARREPARLPLPPVVRAKTGRSRRLTQEGIFSSVTLASSSGPALLSAV